MKRARRLAIALHAVGCSQCNSYECKWPEEERRTQPWKTFGHRKWLALAKRLMKRRAITALEIEEVITAMEKLYEWSNDVARYR